MTYEIRSLTAAGYVAPAPAVAQAPTTAVAVNHSRQPVVIDRPDVLLFRNAGLSPREDKLINLHAAAASRLMAGVPQERDGHTLEAMQQMLVLRMERARDFQRYFGDFPPLMRRFTGPVADNHLMPEGVARYVANAVHGIFGDERIAMMAQDKALAKAALIPIVAGCYPEGPSAFDEAAGVVRCLISSTVELSHHAYPPLPMQSGALSEIERESNRQRFHKYHEHQGMVQLAQTALFTTTFIGDKRRPVAGAELTWITAFETARAARDVRENFELPALEPIIAGAPVQTSANFWVQPSDPA